MTLTVKQYDVLNYIEQEYLLEGYVPTKEQVVAKRICSAQFYDACYKNREFREALNVRGISLAGITPGSEALSPEQLAVANVLLDRFDNRSRKKKLADMGVNTQTLNGWMRDPAFRSYYTRRAEGIFGDVVPEARLALMDNVEKGDFNSIKLALEMTGTYSTKTVGELNVDFLMMKVIEAIQKHVHDAATLEAIAGELGALAPSTPAPVALPSVQYTRIDDPMVVDL